MLFPFSLSRTATLPGGADATAPLSTLSLLLLPQLLAPLSTQGPPTCRLFSAATVSRTLGSLHISPTCVPSHLPRPLVPDPNSQSPGSHAAPAPQPCGCSPSRAPASAGHASHHSLPRCHLGQFYLAKSHPHLTGPFLPLPDLEPGPQHRAVPRAGAQRRLGG